MINIFYSNKQFCLPGSFNELSGKQLIAIAKLQHKEQMQEVAKLMVLQILMRISRLRFFLLPADLKARLTSPRPSPEGEGEKPGFVDWIFRENTLTEQLIPCYKNYYGPKKEFDNLTLGEFHVTETNYQVFVNGDEEEKPEALNNLVAVLYRKGRKGYDTKLDKDGDIRIPFNPNELDYYSRKISKWPLKVKLAIVLYYDGCRQNLCELYDKVFSGGSGADNKSGMFGIIRGLAGTKYGDFDKVELLNIHTALSDIEAQIEEAEEIERQTRAS